MARPVLVTRRARGGNKKEIGDEEAADDGRFIGGRRFGAARIRRRQPSRAGAEPVLQYDELAEEPDRVGRVLRLHESAGANGMSRCAQACADRAGRARQKPLLRNGQHPEKPGRVERVLPLPGPLTRFNSLRAAIQEGANSVRPIFCGSSIPKLM